MKQIRFKSTVIAFAIIAESAVRDINNHVKEHGKI